MSTGTVEDVTYSIQVKTSDKLFAGTDNDVYIRIVCENFVLGVLYWHPYLLLGDLSLK